MTEFVVRLSDFRGYCEVIPMLLELWSPADTAQVQQSGIVASTAFGSQVQRAFVEIAVCNDRCLPARGCCKNGRMLVN